jgi:pilus assembly protein Flp/PilA
MTVMKNLKNIFSRLVRDEQGQDMIEYALLAAFISIVAVALLQTIGTDVRSIYTSVDTATGNAAN